MIIRLLSVAVFGAALAPLQAQQPVPRTDTTGKALRFDFPGMLIGVAEYEEGPTGTTVFYFPRSVKAAVDARGGAPGTINTDAVRLGYETASMDAVVFSGGSWYGLSAATGVANALKEEKAKAGDHDFIAGVLAAIIYDVGDRRFSRVTPDNALGVAAVRAARPGWFPLGARGAGRFAMQGIYFMNDTTAEAYGRWPHSGQGGAFRQAGPTKVAVFTVVNALGLVVGRDGNVVRCGRNQSGAPCPSIATMLSERLRVPWRLGAAPDSGSAPSGNTTLTLVVTNQKMPWWALQRLAVQVHSSMARAIQPFATQYDGDVLYAVTTDEVENKELSPIQLSVLASEVAWDAVLSSVPDLSAPTPTASVALAPGLAREISGAFRFPDGGTLTISTDQGALWAVFTGTKRIYFDVGRRYPLVPIGSDRLLIDGPARDVLQVDRTSGAVSLILNPGSWNQRAQRVSQ